MKIWSLRDDRTGSSKQAESLARALGGEVTIKNIVYNFLIGLPNLIRPHRLGVNFGKSDDLLSGNEVPDVVVSAGRRPAGIAIFLKKYFLAKFNRKVRLITILNPNYSFRHFDLVVLPLHDRERHRVKCGKVVYVRGSLCSPDIPVADSVRNYWGRELEDAKTPFFSLMIGGDIKGYRMNPAKFGLLVRKVSNYVTDREGTLLLSTSRRTTPACLGEIRRRLKCDHYVYRWADRDSIPNPYYLFIEKSNIVFLTGDSISMISEVVTMGKPTYVYMPDELKGTKQESFCRSLFNMGVAREIDQSEDAMDEFKSDETLNELEKVSKFIKNNILDQCS